MKKVYSVFSLLFLAAVVSAQVNITYQVDITDYLAAGNVLGANGIRIGGNFTTVDATSGVADWSPADPSCALTDLGSNVWSITVTYSTAAIGTEQLYKFVNNDWGTNEGTDATNTIGADGCGLDDGAGNVNRTLVIPGQDKGLQFCWDHCFRCDGSDPVLSGINDITYLNSASVTPNPVQNVTAFSYTLTSAQNVSLNVYDMMGNQVASVINNNAQPSGFNAVTFDASDLAAGNYIYRFEVAGKVSSGTFIKQ
ncbi:MAG: T9SS type A sorting domain-containing protein [Fimbriimonadaceae bacterium]|nr:T9SS type A sorting domain-containing protein [Chitinophagales bacterium]